MVSAKSAIEFEIGGVWESPKWLIEFDHEAWKSSGTTPCKHCGPIYTKEHERHDKTTYTEEYFRVPRVVVAYNEGGNSSTGVCLDCILEAVNDGKA